MRLMNILSIILATTLLFTAAAKLAHAQKIEKWDQKTSLVKLQCFDYYRRPVLNVRNDTLNDVAFSDLLRHRGVHMGPMIIINYKILARLSKPSQRFFITHECGHHVLGHLYFRRPGPVAEQEADCYAVRTLIRSGEFTLKHIEAVQQDMITFGRKTNYHLAGEERAAALLKCIES